ncbi:hypothetical protein BOX15_Mlig018403g2 [Macrostomum lignano]|uniref:RING-type domain-containing protein n=2 Tax=Macrostomum lignano TaxID=282301 RepID=A0A1I8G068_9PLAT|nr:hypothetical protein BOX15_Mlig018403g1 [Macrostomum lignano]PAA81601.1 hypothetical protein BOX15_Mlig018403g2 [Macrostomum lignano]
MSRNSEMGAIMDTQWKCSKEIVGQETTVNTNRDECPRNFLNMPKIMHQGWDNKYAIGVPEGFFGANHCNTKWLLNVMGDTSDFRLMRMLKQGRTRIMFETDQYYQLLDQPSKYLKGNLLERPMFNSKVLLFLNPFGIAIYLRYYNALKIIAKQQKYRKPMIYYNQNNYAAFVNDTSSGDVLVFHFDYIILKREAYGAIRHLLAIKWCPGDSSKLVYRRRYYQYITPFLDWVDICRNVIKRKPNLQLSRITQEMVDAHSPQFKLFELKEMGQVMLEYFELKKLTPENYHDANNHGMYAGRKLLHDKEPSLPSDYVKVFENKPARPVIPHAVSAARRFLMYTYYYDYEHLTTLSQILSVTETFLKNRYFSCNPRCIEASWHKDPLLFQIYDIVNMQVPEDLEADQDSEKAKKVVLREQMWSDIAAKPHMSCWFHRFDILNCVSLLFGVMQNCILKNFPSIIIDRICRILIDVLSSSEFIEPLLSYSFYDTFFGLTCLANCVPGLQSTSVMRVMKKAPLVLTKVYSIPQISDMFSPGFWRRRDAVNEDRPATLDEIGEFLVQRKRLMSMRIMTGEGGEGMSCTSAMGNAGSIIMFARQTERMVEVTQAEEETVDSSKSDTVKKAQDEALHIKRFTRQEIDFRYSCVFGQTFRYAVGRPKLILDETKTLSQNEKESRDVPSRLP